MESLNQSLDYESRREKLKLGPFSTCIMIFKTTIGVGIFTFQYAYSLVNIKNLSIVWIYLGDIIINNCL